jgi:hypothetical protein
MNEQEAQKETDAINEMYRKAIVRTYNFGHAQGKASCKKKAKRK